jgi:hypothetical protein
LTNDDVYRLLGQLLADTPPQLFSRGDALQPAHHQWLGRALALAKPLLSSGEYIQLSVAATSLGGALKTSNAQSISVLLHMALANAEIAASMPLKGMFLPAASPFDAFVQIGKVFAEGKHDILIVDPYADEKLLDEFARQAKDGVNVRLLAETGKLKATLAPAKVRWVAQFQSARPLEVRAASGGALHDRLVIVDGSDVWSIGQSFNQLAARASTTILRMDSEPADLKRFAMEAIWNSATIL